MVRPLRHLVVSLGEVERQAVSAIEGLVKAKAQAIRSAPDRDAAHLLFKEFMRLDMVA